MALEWLESIRKEKGMTQEEVAVRAGITRNYYTMIEHSGRCPRVPVAKKIAEVLGFDWTRFFEDKSNDLLPKDHSA